MTRVERFLFAPVDARVLAWFRIAFVAMLVYSFWPRGSAGYGAVLRDESLAWLYTDVFLTIPWWAACVAVAAAFAFGPWTRSAGLLLLTLLLPFVAAWGAGQSRQILLFALAALCLLRGRRDGPVAGPMWPIRLIQLQVSLVYGVNAYAKTNLHYLSGDALIGLSYLRNWRADMSDGFWHIGALAVPVAIAASASALTEWWLSVAFWWKRLRPFAVATGLAFHAVLTQIVAIFMLDLATIFLYAAFLVPFEVRDRAAPNRGR